jgi:hypothetical protein
MRCSEILNVRLPSRGGRKRELKVNLEEIWSSGAIFWSHVRMRKFTFVRFVGGGYEFRGQVIAGTLLKGLGYFVEMRFHPRSVWSEEKYRPKHIFNPLVHLANRIFETTLCAPKSMALRPGRPPARRRRLSLRSDKFLSKALGS